MDDRPGSPEINVVGDGERTGVFRSQSERTVLGKNSRPTNLRATNQNGGNRAAANTKRKETKGETVNLRVRHMGKIIVKKEPESDEDSEVSYSLSSLLEECDFEKAPARKSRALKSPTSLAMARSRSNETSRPATGRPRQSLENVISSLKSARATGTKPNLQNPSVPILMPSQIASTAPSSQSTFSSSSSGALGSGPQIIDVRSLATGAQTAVGGASARTAKSTTSVSRVQVSASKQASSSSPKPLNIRFVLPATEPFNSSEFQQILQTALASVISQSKGVEASILQQAIQAALTTITKSSLPLNAKQLQLAIQSSLADLSGTAKTSQATSTNSIQVPPAHLPQTVQTQAQAVAPKPTYAASQPVARIGTAQTVNQPSSSNTSSGATQIVTKDNSATVNGNSQSTAGVSALSAAPLDHSSLNMARDALIKALQEKRVLNTPASLSSSASPSTIEDSVPMPDSFDEPCSDFPPSSPVLAAPETTVSNSASINRVPVTIPISLPNITTAPKTVVPPPTHISNKGSSKPYIKPNESPMNSGTQTALKSAPQQLVSTQRSTSALPMTSTRTLMPGTAGVNLITQTNPTVQPTRVFVPASKVPQAIAPTQLVQFSLYPTIPQTPPVIKPAKKAAQTQTTPMFGCGGGCCQYCRTCHENNNRCGLPSCGKTYTNRAGLRKHYHFNPTHKPQIPLEKSTTACDNFIPLELGESHRRARLRELFKRLPDEEFQELIKPRLAKVMSLYQLLEEKSLRVSVGNVSPFKMFTEFERFRKEVEGKLMEFILMPQGKPQRQSTADVLRKMSSNNDGKPADVKSSASSGEAAKQSSKDSTPAATAKTDEKVESAVTQPKADTSTTAGSSDSAKKTVETICLDSDVEMSTAKATDEKSASGDQATSSQASDSSSTEGKSAESSKESGKTSPTSTPNSATVPSAESLTSKDGEKKEGELSKQSSSSPQTLGGDENTSLSKPDQPTGTEQPKKDELPGPAAGEAPPKDSTSVPMEVDEQADGKPSESQTSDVTMVDSQKEVASGSKDGKEKSSEEEKVKESQNETVEKDKPAVGTGEEKQSVEASGEDKTSLDDKEQPEKPPDSNESKTNEDKVAEKGTEATTQEGKTTEKLAEEKKETSAMDVEEQETNAKTDSKDSQVKDAAEEKTDKVEAKAAEPKTDDKDVGDDNQKEAAKAKVEEPPKAGSDVPTAGGSEQAPEVAMETEKVEVDSSKVGDSAAEDASNKKTSNSVESGSDQVKEVPKSSETTAESVKPKDPSTAIGKGEENAKTSSSVTAPGSSDTTAESEKPKDPSTTIGKGEENAKRSSSVTAPGSSDTNAESEKPKDSSAAIGKGEENGNASSSVTAPGSSDTTAESEKPKDSSAAIGKGEENGNTSSSVTAPGSSDTNAESEKPKDSSAAIGKGEENVKTSSSETAPASSDTAGSSGTTSAGSSNAKAPYESDPVKGKKKHKYITLEDLDLGDDDDDDDENYLLDFTLPFAVKWGRIVKNVRSSEAKKIARKENYSEQDMKHFIYNKPKDAANAVIFADCHAHPSFFRAYVMPALLDVHIDDFGLFGKKLLSRLYLPKEKYVKVLRDGIGPELAKILGINIFPTFKRIQDTWHNLKTPLGNANSLNKSKSKTVLSIDAADDFDVPDEASTAAPADKTAGSSAGKAADSLKRPGPTDNVQNDNNKRQRLDNSTDAPKDGTKEPAKSPEETTQKDASLPSEPNKEQKSNEADGSKQPAQDDTSNKSGKSDSTAVPVINLESKENKTGSTSSTSVAGKESTPQSAVINLDEPSTDTAEPMSVDQKQDPKSPSKEGPAAPSVAVEKSKPSTSSVETTPKASSSADKPSTSAGDTAAKTCATSIIPSTATIYTSGVGKKGAAQVPLPTTTKGSPLFLIPVEKISPKLIEQFIQQGKGDGVKTRSREKQKAKKPKQNSQVLVLIPSPQPNGSPTIQALTSAEQLESNGDKKPLLLLPADKVPKSISSQSQTVRRKMVITMVAPSSGAASGTKSTTSTAASASATSTTTTGDQSADATSPVQSVKGPIMSTKEGTTTTTLAVNSSASVTKKTSPLNTPIQSISASGPTAADKATLQSTTSANDSDSSATNKESSVTKEGTSSEASTSATPNATDAELDLLGSSMLPSDFTLDSLLKDIDEDGSGGEVNEMPPLDVSEIIKSFEDMPAESVISTPADSALSDSEGDTGAVGDSSESTNEVQMASSIQEKSSIQDEQDYASSRRQSPRRAASSKTAAETATVDTPDPNTSGGSKEDSDTEEGSPPRKRRKTPTRTSVRSSPQVTFVPDKEVAAKSSQGSPAKAKGRK